MNTISNYMIVMLKSRDLTVCQNAVIEKSFTLSIICIIVIHTQKQILVPPKYKIIFDAISNVNFSNIAIVIYDILLPILLCSSNFAIAKVIALILIFCMGLYIEPWLLFCIVPSIVIALPTIVIAIFGYIVYLFCIRRAITNGDQYCYHGKWII